MVLRPTASALRRALAAAGTASLVLLLAAPAGAGAPGVRFTQLNQVSDQAGVAKLQDPDLVNSWGLAFGPAPATPLWVADNGSDKATVYLGGVNGAPVTKSATVVAITGGAPTGEIFNDTSSFTVGGSPALFVFASEAGDITAWTRGMTTAPVMAQVNGAVFKGLTLWHTPFGPVLLATDFVGGHVLAFDGAFHQITLPDFLFRDPRLPAGYAPFNIMAVGDTVYVTYAKQQPGSHDEAHGPGLGFVDAYTHLGTLVHRIASRGPLNAPWGMAMAPGTFGHFAGDLLVGNFGDGHISAYRGGDFQGQLRDATNHPIAIDGLWGLMPGTASMGGTGTLWFSAGPKDENDGLLGQLIPAA